MTKSARIWLFIAGISGACAVALGAYGAHGLNDGPEYLRESFNTGVQYQMWHTLALIGVAWICTQGGRAGKLASFAGCAFSTGIVVFSGSLYYFGLNGELLVNGAPPLGGFSYMAGWCLLGFSGWYTKDTEKTASITRDDL